ncbi:MAG TPA: flagellar basal body L-ring protein FlgH [Candidatus Acidoferrum sp.]|nr:flagellar basal body L-ring protein FlgH [Candidatus Acidoferrum sp.]
MKPATTSRLLSALAILLMTGGCAMMPGMPHKEAKKVAVDPIPQPRMPAVHIDGTIYTAGTELTLFDDIKAHRVGDILTVLLQEANAGTKSSDAKITQSTGASIDPPVLGGVTKNGLSLSAASSNKFAGENDSSQSNSLTGSVTVTVTEVLAGGNLRVAGEKWIEINEGKEYIKLDGIIRPADVKPNNTVLSTQVADAHISYSGKGAAGSASIMGWVSRILFSPFRLF